MFSRVVDPFVGHPTYLHGQHFLSFKIGLVHQFYLSGVSSFFIRFFTRWFFGF